MQDCAFHPDRRTLLACSKCGNAACPDCLVHVAVGQHCVGCLDGQPAAHEPGQTKFKVKPAVVGLTDADRERRPGKVFFGIVGLFVALCAVAWLAEGYFENSAPVAAAKAVSILIVIVGALLGLAFHEWAHAIVAYHGGDRSVSEKGYLTLDPRKYSDPILSIAMPMVFLLIGGLPLPGGAVWINHHHLRSKWWDSAVSLAGPAINLLGALLIIGVSATGIFGGHEVVESALLFLAYIEIGIVILNLLPIPGLDGYGVIEPHLSDGVQQALRPIRQYASIILLLLILNTSALSFIWDWSYSATAFLGVDGELLSLGHYLASPKLI